MTLCRARSAACASVSDATSAGSRRRRLRTDLGDIPDDALEPRPLDGALGQHVAVIATCGLFVGEDHHDVPVPGPRAVQKPGIPILPCAISGTWARSSSMSEASISQTPNMAHIPKPLIAAGYLVARLPEGPYRAGLVVLDQRIRFSPPRPASIRTSARPSVAVPRRGYGT